MAKKAYIGIGGVARSVKRVYIGVHQVPQAQYAVLEYIESAGTQYINTGVAPTDHEVRATFDSVDYNNDAALFGTANGSRYYHFTEYSNKYYWGRNGSEASGGTWATGQRSLIFNSGNTYAVILDDAVIGSGTAIVSSAVLNIFCRATDKFYYGRLYSLIIADKSTGANVRDFIPVRRLSDNAVGLYDRVETKFYSNAGTGEFTAGAETGEYIYDIPQEGDYARKVKKAYIGVGGVARPCLAGGTPVYYGAYNLSVARDNPAGTSNGRYSIFAGGATSSSVSNVVDTIDTSLTLGTATTLSDSKSNPSAVTIGSYMVVAGGHRSSGWSDNVDAYNDVLTKSTATALSAARDNFGGAVVGGRAVFAGGSNSSVYYMTTVDVYDANLSRTSGTALSKGRYSVFGVSFHNHALFLGGVVSGGKANSVDVYDEDLTRTTGASLSEAKDAGAVVNLNDEYALFAGGRLSSTVTKVLEVYNKDLTRTTGDALSVARVFMGGAAVNGYAIFGGGDNRASSKTYYATVDLYDSDLTHTVGTSLSLPRSGLNRGAAALGDYALFPGGSNGSVQKTIDVYAVI